MKTRELMQLNYTQQEIHKKRSLVRMLLISSSANIKDGEINRISRLDLELLFQFYDSVFLNNYFSQQFKGTILFSLSSRMTRSAGMTCSPKNLHALSPEQERYEIKIGARFLFNYGQLERDKKVNGIQCRDPLDALQLVFEHEICHLIELHCCRKSSCRNKRFISLAFQLFGHTEGYHHLPTGKEIAAVKYGFRPGMNVRFEYEGIYLNGFIQRITQRATVMVPHEQGDYQDQQGNRYAKYYVPVTELETIET